MMSHEPHPSAAPSEGPYALVSYIHSSASPFWDEQWGHTQIVGTDGHQIAVVYSTGPDSVDRDRQRANAMLLVAAWDLLAALKAVVAIADRSTVEFDAARAAIAKAEAQWAPDQEIVPEYDPRHAARNVSSQQQGE